MRYHQSSLCHYYMKIPRSKHLLFDEHSSFSPLVSITPSPTPC